MKGDVQVLNEKVQGLEGDMRGLQLTLENLKAESEKEMMHLRVNVLENDMRKVKEKVGIA